MIDNQFYENRMNIKQYSFCTKKKMKKQTWTNLISFQPNNCFSFIGKTWANFQDSW